MYPILNYVKRLLLTQTEALAVVGAENISDVNSCQGALAHSDGSTGCSWG